MQVLAIADDTTGALEVGAQFVARGFRSRVTTGSELIPEAGALVVDAQTRHLTPAQARDRVIPLALAARDAAVPYIYKKTDSTLRGNIADEFQALLDVFPERSLYYVPAYPQMGRVVIDGELYVDGLRLAETAFARDPLNPSREGSIPALLAGRVKAPVLLAGRGAPLLEHNKPSAIIVCNGQTEEDLRTAAAAVAEAGLSCIVAGTGGFAGHWIGALPVERNYAAGRPAAERCLVLNGSLHPASLEQVERGAASGIPIVYTFSELAAALQKCGWTALEQKGDRHIFAASTGDLVRRMLDQKLVDGLVVFGGDTVFAVLQAIGVAVIESCGELLPGIPLSLIRYGEQELALVTKAGGFGAADTLISIRQQLEKEE